MKSIKTKLQLGECLSTSISLALVGAIISNVFLSHFQNKDTLIISAAASKELNGQDNTIMCQNSS